MKKLDSRQLRQRDALAFVAALIGSGFLVWDFWRAVDIEVPTMGWTGFLLGPICQHKISEFIVAGSWMFAAVMSNHSHAEIWPDWMPPRRYVKALRWLSVAMTVAIAPAVYAWTVLNLGTSPLTTGYPPRQEYLWAWRGYLGIVVIAAMAFPLLMGPVGNRLAQREDACA